MMSFTDGGLCNHEKQFICTTCRVYRDRGPKLTGRAVQPYLTSWKARPPPKSWAYLGRGVLRRTLALLEAVLEATGESLHVPVVSDRGSVTPEASYRRLDRQTLAIHQLRQCSRI